MLNVDYVSDQGWLNATATYRICTVRFKNSNCLELLLCKIHKRDLFPFYLTDRQNKVVQHFVYCSCWLSEIYALNFYGVVTCDLALSICAFVALHTNRRNKRYQIYSEDYSYIYRVKLDYNYTIEKAELSNKWVKAFLLSTSICLHRK